MTPQRRESLVATYRDGLLRDVLPFWLKHGWAAREDLVVVQKPLT